MQQQDPKNLNKALQAIKKSYNDFSLSMDEITSKIKQEQTGLDKELTDSESKAEDLENAVIEGLKSTLVDK